MRQKAQKAQKAENVRLSGKLANQSDVAFASDRPQWEQGANGLEKQAPK